MLRTGGCFCGGVEYQLESDIFAARSCHCSRCRKAFSSQASSYAMIEPQSLKWVRGEELLVTYPQQGEEGRQFCGVCGTVLCGIVGGEIHGITLGSLNEDQGIEIKAHIFVGSKASWEVIPENVPQYEGFPSNMDVLTKP